MKIGVITSGGRIARWQAQALSRVAAGNQFLVYDCANSQSSRRVLAHAAYYLMNLFSVRNRETAMVGLPSELEIIGRTSFDAEIDGAWERLPRTLLARIAKDMPEVIVKFGMGLLRVPPKAELAPPILSYHHGDPRRFRGRPAGFYELLQGERVIGQIVQVLGNRVDAGEVVAFAETKAQPHSWRQTLVDAFRVSPLLLPLAIRNAIGANSIAIECGGRNYRLPSTATAARVALELGAAKARRLAYGAMVEKRWRVASARVGGSLAELQTLEEAPWTRIGVPRPYKFLADPFFDRDGNILAEAMPANGRGAIVRFAGERHEPLPIGGGHLSYPCTFHFEGKTHVLPEMAGWSLPRIYEVTAAGAEPRGELDLDGRPRLLDATLYQQDGAWFLFANRKDEGSGVLRLWTADSPFGRFVEHPASPIRISPAGGRMGGGILELGDGRYRPGQDFRRGYGDGLLLFRIDALSPTTYRESEAASLRFTHCRGPHTLNLHGGRALFDFYEDRVTPLAGWRRLKQRRST